MTTRRSIHTESGRISRAFQFVPGHVGGRVASAQPVRRRRTVGGASAPAATPPETLTYTRLSAAGTTTDTLPSLSGVTSAVVMVHCIGATDIMTVEQQPAGWTTLLNSRSDAVFGGNWTPLYWAAFKIDHVTGSESLTYGWTEKSATHAYVRGLAIYASGGSGGSWNVHLDDGGGGAPGSVSFADVIPDGAPYGQWCAARGGRSYTVPGTNDPGTGPLVGPVMSWPIWETGTIGVSSLPAPLTPAQTMSWTSTYSDEYPYARPMQAWWQQQ